MDEKNAIVHFEIPADDPERAVAFYKDIFGWGIEKMDMPEDSSTGGDPYYIVRTAETDDNHMIKKPGAINGGLMKRKSPSQPFMNYINVDDIEKVLTDVKEKGGETIMPKTAIAPGMGFIGAFKDTEGNIMGLHQMDPKMTGKE